MGIRPSGGSVICERGRILEREKARVLGIGVADRYKISTSGYFFFSVSLCLTPNLCSSSMIRSPRFLKFKSLDKIRCVPTTISILPSLIFLKISLVFSRDSSLVNLSISIPSRANLFLKVSECWSASTVVGERITTCFPFNTARRAARSAISVFPNPTSPTTNLSIGSALAISRKISSMAVF